jgi:hypothetical protein
MKSDGSSRRAVSAKRSRQRQGKSTATTWHPPEPLGYPASIQALGGFAAPLLAATSFTMTALLLPTLSSTSKNFVRWPDAALTLFVAGGLAQIAAVQATMWARRYDTSPDELSQWFPDEVLDGRPSEWLRNVQDGTLEQSQLWANRTRLAYHLGILLLLAGLTTTVVPPGSMSLSRWVLVTTACSGLVGELCWSSGRHLLTRVAGEWHSTAQRSCSCLFRRFCLPRQRIHEQRSSLFSSRWACWPPHMLDRC